MSYEVDISDIHHHNIDIESREIYLNNFSGVDNNPGVDYRMAQNFIKNINILSKASNKWIRIHMHSIGGNWSDGMAIYDAITASNRNVEIITYGQAESMSGIILQAATKRSLLPNSYFMLHFGSVGYESDYLSFQKVAEWEKYNAETMLNIYANRCITGPYFKQKKYSASKIKTFIKDKLKEGDWFLRADEAVDYGFADSIIHNINL